jgi:hypothetical protein
MNRLRACRGGGGEDGRDVEIGLRGVWRPDIDGFVRHLHGERVGVGDAVSLNGRHPELARRALDAHGDLAAIGDQEPRETHSRHLDERLSRHDGLFAVDDEFDDLAGDVGVHLDERLHHLDQADHLADLRPFRPPT